MCMVSAFRDLQLVKLCYRTTNTTHIFKVLATRLDHIQIASTGCCVTCAQRQCSRINQTDHAACLPILPGLGSAQTLQSSRTDNTAIGMHEYDRMFAGVNESASGLSNGFEIGGVVLHFRNIPAGGWIVDRFDRKALFLQWLSERLVERPWLHCCVDDDDRRSSRVAVSEGLQDLTLIGSESEEFRSSGKTNKFVPENK